MMNFINTTQHMSKNTIIVAQIVAVFDFLICFASYYSVMSSHFIYKWIKHNIIANITVLMTAYTLSFFLPEAKTYRDIFLKGVVSGSPNRQNANLELRNQRKRKSEPSSCQILAVCSNFGDNGRNSTSQNMCITLLCVLLMGFLIFFFHILSDLCWKFCHFNCRSDRKAAHITRSLSSAWWAQDLNVQVDIYFSFRAVQVFSDFIVGLCFFLHNCSSMRTLALPLRENSTYKTVCTF